MNKDLNQLKQKNQKNKKVVLPIHRSQNLATRFEHRKPERKAK
jgi:hypothetical protein